MQMSEDLNSAWLYLTAIMVAGFLYGWLLGVVAP
jgi:hypothetical protein